MRPFRHSYKRVSQLYPKQAAFIDNPERLTFVEASTKAGKTAACILWIYEQTVLNSFKGQNFWWVAPVYSQARIAFDRLRVLAPRDFFKVNKTDLCFETQWGARIWFKSGENPDNLYGEDVYALVIDEASRMRRESWEALRSTLTKTRGPAKIIGNVRGTSNWFWELCRKAENGELKDAAYFRLTVDDAIAAGVIDKAEIEQAQIELPPAKFRELYYAEPSKQVTSPFAFNFDAFQHVRDLKLPDPTKPEILWLSFDFNVNPITAIVCTHDAQYLDVLQEYRLENSDIYKLCGVIRKDYPKAQFWVTGDASGNNRSALTRGNATYYHIILQELRLNSKQIRVPAANPPIKSTQQLLNLLLSKPGAIRIASRCQFLIDDLELVETDESGAIDKTADAHRTHLLDCFRYYLWTFHNHRLK